MKAQIVDSIIILNLCSIWIIPAIGILRFHKYDNRFLCRQWLFPMQYWLQVTFEKLTGNRRFLVRLLHIFSPFITIYLIFPAGLALKAFHEPFARHYVSLYSLVFYLFLSALLYWFQPKAGKVYKRHFVFEKALPFMA
jgi:hypothetical protein